MGTHTYQNGNVYSGEFRHGERYGFGVLEIKFIGQSTDNVIGWNEPAIYVGSFKDGFRNGYGNAATSADSQYRRNTQTARESFQFSHAIWMKADLVQPI